MLVREKAEDVVYKFSGKSATVPRLRENEFPSAANAARTDQQWAPLHAYFLT